MALKVGDKVAFLHKKNIITGKISHIEIKISVKNTKTSKKDVEDFQVADQEWYSAIDKTFAFSTQAKAKQKRFEAYNKIRPLYNALINANVVDSKTKFYNVIDNIPTDEKTHNIFVKKTYSTITVESKEDTTQQYKIVSDKKGLSRVS